VFFCAEAYDNDPAKLCDGHVMDALLAAGFDAVYDDPIYDVLEGLYEDGKWCNDLDALVRPGVRFDRSLRYGENHDEVRLAHPRTFGGLGMEVGRPVTAVLYLLGRGPLMLYMGQEVGEPALGERGFGAEFGGVDAGNARTTIFDYGWCPEVARWYADGQCDGAGLAPERHTLRAWYRDLLALAREPAFVAGATYPLNGANLDNPRFGRRPGEAASGHDLYAFVRGGPGVARPMLVVANFHPTEAADGCSVRLTAEAAAALDEGAGPAGARRWWPRSLGPGQGGAAAAPAATEGPGGEVALLWIAPLSAIVLEWR